MLSAQVPFLSAAQVYDWLQEKEEVSDVAENTVRNYVKELRDIYHIPKRVEERATGSVEELPPGSQIQVDFGQSRVIDSEGNVHRLYFVGFVLAHSRFKYVEFLQGTVNEKYKKLVAPERSDDTYIKVLQGGLARRVTYCVPVRYTIQIMNDNCIDMRRRPCWIKVA